MQSFQRAFALSSIVIAAGFFVGCGGAGKPVPGSSDPAKEAADAALAPEGVQTPSAAGTEGGQSKGATKSSEAPPDGSTPSEAASAPESDS